MGSNSPASAAARVQPGVVNAVLVLAAVNVLLGWLATAWALSQAAAALSAGRETEGWTLPARWRVSPNVYAGQRDAPRRRRRPGRTSHVS